MEWSFMQIIEDFVIVLEKLFHEVGDKVAFTKMRDKSTDKFEHVFLIFSILVNHGFEHLVYSDTKLVFLFNKVFLQFIISLNTSFCSCDIQEKFEFLSQFSTIIKGLDFFNIYFLDFFIFREGKTKNPTQKANNELFLQNSLSYRTDESKFLR